MRNLFSLMALGAMVLFATSASAMQALPIQVVSTCDMKTVSVEHVPESGVQRLSETWAFNSGEKHILGADESSPGPLLVHQVGKPLRFKVNGGKWVQVSPLKVIVNVQLGEGPSGRTTTPALEAHIGCLNTS